MTGKSFRRSVFMVIFVALMMHTAVPMFAQQKSSSAIELFSSLSPQQALGYLKQMPDDQRQGFLAQLGKEACICVLKKIGEEGMKMLVSQLSPEDSQAFFDNLNPKTYMQFVGSVKDPELLSSLGFDDPATRDQYVLGNLSSLDKESATVVLQQLLLSTEDPATQQAILDLTGNDSETASFLALTPAERAQLLSESSPAQLQALGAKLSEMTDFLQGVEPSAIADALDMLNTEDAAFYLSASDTNDIAAILEDMDSLSQLQGLMEAYASDLKDLGVDTAAIDSRIAALEEAQTALAEEYGLSYDDIQEAGAEMMAESTQTPEDGAGAESTQAADGTGTSDSNGGDTGTGTTDGGSAPAESTSAP